MINNDIPSIIDTHPYTNIHRDGLVRLRPYQIDFSCCSGTTYPKLALKILENIFFNLLV